MTGDSAPRPCQLMLTNLKQYSYGATNSHGLSDNVEVRRAPIGPGLWPGPRRQARWAGGASPDNARRSGPAGCGIFTVFGVPGVSASAWSWCWRARQRDTARTAGGRSPGCRARQPPRRRTCAEGRGEKLPPRNGETPGEPRPPKAGHPGRSFPLDCSRPSSLFTAWAVRPGAPKVRP